MGQKWYKLALQGWHGNGVKYNVQKWVIFFSFLYFSCHALENTFLGVSPYFLHWMMCFGGD